MKNNGLTKAVAIAGASAISLVLIYNGALFFGVAVFAITVLVVFDSD